MIDEDKIPLTDDRDTFPRICPHCMTVITARGSHAGADGYNACVGYGWGEHRASDPHGVVAALRLRDRALLALVERVAAVDPVVDTSRGGCCDSTPELTCGLCGRRTYEFLSSHEIDGAGYDAAVREGTAPFAHRYDCPHLVAKDLVEGVDRLAERRAEDWERQARLALGDCVQDVETFAENWVALVEERERILSTVDPERGRPTNATPRLPQFHGANLYLRAAATGAVYALALFAATAE